MGPVYTDATLGSIRPVTRYGYDNLGHLTTIAAGRTDSSGTNPSSDVVATQMSYAYDDFGRKIRETDALGRSWTFVYNTYGDVVQITDPKNQITQLSYFRSSHQLETRIDHAGNQTTYARNPLGQVFSAASPAATTTYEYDKAHRLASATDSRSGQSVAYRYSPGGLLNQMQVGASVTDYLYDPVGRLTGIWAPSNDLISYAYDRGGRLTEQWLPNGANTRYSYNADNTVQQIINRNRSGAIISQHDYTYDAGGHRLTHLETIAGTTTPYKYVYDELARLKEVRHNSTNALIEGYGYDPLGNRTTKTDGTTTLAYLYDAANQLKEIRQGSDTGTLLASLDYDPNGNLTSKSEGATTTTLTYDALNRLIQAAKTGQATQTYLYDAEGRRIKKTIGSTVTQYLYNGPDILAEYGASWSTAAATYTHGPRMDDPLLRATATGTQYYHQDGLGSVVALSDATGGITGTARYDAWGNPLAITGAVPQYGYTGREPDETGLIYYRGRYYDPAIGRFTQPDPIGLQGGMNLYAYVNNNPVNFTDPWGLTPLNAGTNTTQTFNTSYFNSSFDSSGGFYSGSQSLTPNAWTNIAIGYTETGIGAEHHAFVVATDLATGKQVFTRGGPSSSGFWASSTTAGASSIGGSLAASSGDGGSGGYGWGSIYAQGGDWDESARVDRPSGTVAMQVVGNTPMTLNEVQSRMTEFQNVTNSSQIPYFPTGPNSNAYAFTFVESLGIPRPSPVKPVPGWSRSLGIPSESRETIPFYSMQ